MAAPDPAAKSTVAVVLEAAVYSPLLKPVAVWTGKYVFPPSVEVCTEYCTPVSTGKETLANAVDPDPTRVIVGIGKLQVGNPLAGDTPTCSSIDQPDNQLASLNAPWKSVLTNQVERAFPVGPDTEGLMPPVRWATPLCKRGSNVPAALA